MQWLQVERFLVEAFDSDPVVGVEATRLSAELGASYAALKDSPAWLHLVRHVLQAREQLVEKILDNPVQNAHLRDTVRFIDLMLRAPEKMIREGKLSAIALRAERERANV